MKPHVVAVNISRRFVLTDAGRVLPISNLYDADGDETDDPKAAIACVAGAENLWFAINLAEFENVASN